MGYALFGLKLESVFILNMPLNLVSSYVVIVITVHKLSFYSHLYKIGIMTFLLDFNYFVNFR